MSQKERDRKVIFEAVKTLQMTLREASARLGVCYRQVCRLWQRYRAHGDAGLVHRSRGRVPNRRIDPAVRAAVMAHYRHRYEGFGPTLACEKLRAEGFVVDHETLRRWLVADGLWCRRRKRGPYRQRRARRERFGELVQLDGSPHAWFGPEMPQACLMNLVDDATGRSLALLVPQERTEGALRVAKAWIMKYGIPQTIYADRHTIYRTDREPTVAEQLAGDAPLTVFGQAVKRVGIALIHAHSPQAKGRVERSHGVYQDRLVKEIRLRGLTTVEAVNALLAEDFCEALNRRFAKPPAHAADAHRPAPANLDLDQVLCWEEGRQLTNDWTIRYQNVWYQIERGNRPLPRPKAKITVRRHLDGTITCHYQGQPLRFTVLDAPVAKPAAAASPRPAPRRRHSTPPPDHSWRKPFRVTSQKQVA